MIFVIIGGVGSGKTLAIVKSIVDTPNISAFVNFNVKAKNAVRLKMSHILINEHDIDALSDKKTDKRKLKQKVNWQFWEDQKKKRFSIYLDEAHNIINSRRSMSSRNVLLGNWVSQIRKILGDSKESHLFIITQKLKKIDVNFRDLAHCIIECKKYEAKDGNIWIKQKFYSSEDNYMMRRHFMMKAFLGNAYFKYYDTREMINFGDDEAGLL